MQSSLAKSLYIGLAALSFGAVATVSTTANAASKAKVTSSQTLKTAADTRNVEVTGKNALYSKPGTVKGAKVVASKKTMAKLASSKKSADYFRAYYQKTTNKGSVYYKIVSMNGKYRGYIYGGKKAGTFAGGIDSANTTTKAAMPAKTTVYFTKPGKSNVTWDAPKYTQYKASKQIKDTTAYASDPLTVTDAATKTREGSLYYYVKDAKNPAINGWIFAGAVSDTATTANTYNEKTDVKVNIKTIDGTNIKSTTLTGLKGADGKVSTAVGTAVGASAADQANNTWGQSVLAGTGYTYEKTDTANKAALASAKTGDTITLVATKNADAATKVQFYALNSDQTQGATPLTAYTKDTKAASATTVVFPAVNAAFTGAADATYTAADLQAYLTSNSLNTLNTPSYKNTKGVQVYTKYTFNNAVAGTYSTTKNAQAFYTATEVPGASPVDAQTNGSSANYFA